MSMYSLQASRQNNTDSHVCSLLKGRFKHPSALVNQLHPVVMLQEVVLRGLRRHRINWACTLLLMANCLRRCCRFNIPGVSSAGDGRNVLRYPQDHRPSTPHNSFRWADVCTIVIVRDTVLRALELLDINTKCRTLTLCAFQIWPI